MSTHPLGMTITGNDGTSTRRADKGPAPPGATMLGGFENKTAIVTMSELAVDADCAQFVSENTAHDGDHAP